MDPNYQKEEEIRRLVEKLGGMTPGGSRLASTLASLQNGLDSAGTKAPPAEYSAELPFSFFTRSAYINSFEATKAEKRLGPGSCQQIRHSTAPAIEHGVAPALKTLKPISLVEVAKRVNYIHHDRVLFATVAYEPCRIIGTNLLIQDEEGDLGMVGLYNYVQPSEKPNDILPRGTNLALLAPYMRNGNDDKSKSQSLMIRCDNPQCVVVFNTKAAWLAAKDGREPPPEQDNPSDLRKKGNEAFAKGSIKSAILLYSRALSNPSVGLDDKLACLSNRAETFLRSEQWEDAERDCRAVLDMQQDHIKAKFRLVKALLRLGQASEATVVMKTLVMGNPSDPAFQVQLRECERLLQEEKGLYDLAAMRKEANSAKPTAFHADYVSGDISIGEHVSKPEIGSYCGCVATCSIDEGSIICASKAFVFIPRSESDDFQIRVNVYTKQLEKGSDIALISGIIGLLWRRPELCKKLYQLSSGGDYSDQTDPKKINIQRIRGIKTSNTFKANLESAEVMSDWEKVKKQQQGRMTEADLREHATLATTGDGSGLWINESMFNHSCTPNCSWSQIGDHMFVRSTRSVPKGEELCIAYCSGDVPYKDRVEMFNNWVRPGVGFRCACDWCCLLRSNRQLRNMESEVVSAYHRAAELVTMQQMPMAVAAEKVMPEQRRKTILAAFQDVPPKLKHQTVQMLEVMQGTIWNAKGESKAAFECYKRAAEIGYFREGATYGHCKDLWRLVGSAMHCGRGSEAVEYLEKIKNMNCFSSVDSKEASKAFIELTIKYAGPWWFEEWNPRVQQELWSMAARVWQGTQAPTTGARSGKGKKKNKKNHRK